MLHLDLGRTTASLNQLDVFIMLQYNCINQSLFFTVFMNIKLVPLTHYCNIRVNLNSDVLKQNITT